MRTRKSIQPGYQSRRTSSEATLQKQPKEDKMLDPRHDADTFTPRRGFFGRIAAGAMALGFAGLAPNHVRAVQETLPDDEWPGELKGRHRQVVDAYVPNEGFPLGFVYTFLVTNRPATANVVAASALIVLRHTAFPIALDHAMWQKYKIGEALKIIDPETNAPATKNPFFHPKPGVLVIDDISVDRLLANGVIFGACNIALQFFSSKLAGAAGVSSEQAAKEWTANVIPGITLIPSGTWGVNRAQERGCTYCAGG
jgi:hypothetical protein